METELKPIIQNFVKHILSDDRGVPVDPSKIHQLDELLQKDYKGIDLGNLEELLHQIPNLWPKIQRTLENLLLDTKDMVPENRKRILENPYETIVYMGPQNIKHIFYDVNWQLHLSAYNDAMVSARIFHVQSMLAHKILPLILNPEWLNEAYRSSTVKNSVHFEPTYGKKDIDLLEASYACLFSNLGYVLSSVIFKNEFRLYTEALRQKSRELIDSSFEEMEIAKYENIFMPIYFRNALERRHLNYFVETITKIYLNETGLPHLANWVSHHLTEHIESAAKPSGKLAEKHGWSKGAMIIAALIVSKQEVNPENYPLLDIWQHAIASFPRGGRKERDKRINILSRVLLKYFPGFRGDHQELFNKLETICRNDTDFSGEENFIEQLKSKMQKTKPGGEANNLIIVPGSQFFPLPLSVTAARLNDVYSEFIRNVRQGGSAGSASEMVKLIRDYSRFMYLFLANASAAADYSDPDSNPESIPYNSAERFFRNALKLTEKNLLRMCDVKIHDTIMKLSPASKDYLPQILSRLYSFIMNDSWNTENFKQFHQVMKIVQNLFARGELRPYRIFIPSATRSGFSNNRVINSFIRLEGSSPEVIDFISDSDPGTFARASELYEKHRYPRFFRDVTYEDLRMEDNKTVPHPLFPVKPDWFPLEPFIVVDAIHAGSRTEYTMKLLTQISYNEKTLQYILQYQRFDLVDFSLAGADPAVLSPPGAGVVQGRK